MWKSLGGIMMNGIPWKIPQPKTLGAFGPSGFWPWDLPRDSIHPLGLSTHCPSTLCTRHCTLYTIHCTRHCTLYSVQYQAQGRMKQIETPCPMLGRHSSLSSFYNFLAADYLLQNRLIYNKQLRHYETNY